jgi:DnaK suppressor protein
MQVIDMTNKTVPEREDAEMQRRLLERSGELRADIQRELRKDDDEHSNQLADSVADSGEQSVADLLVDVDLAEITRDLEELRDIEAALSRMAHGVYGVRVDCAAQIDRARLHYAPSAARCVPC